MPKNTPPETHLTRRNDHQLGIIRASAYSRLCRIRHSVETRTAGSESGLGKRTDGNTGTAPQADSTMPHPVRVSGSIPLLVGVVMNEHGADIHTRTERS